MGSEKRKKHHDRDKYYKLAKEQGLRSRAAFKLSQINRKFPVLNKAQSVLDLGAAPGGWTQIASRTCQNANIIAVDILPIRKIPNVTTIIGDITTAACKAEIKRAVNQQAIDVVLHDGAPNVGAEYSKDAYEQNELALHALKTACQHLKPNGTFITKIYRSRDYAKFQFVVNCLFDKLDVIKPAASRPQSAEIFWVCRGYKHPDKIDPKLLDPKHVFESLDDESTGAFGTQTLSIFHKHFDKPRRQRSGYDHGVLDFTMRHIRPVHEFVSVSTKEAIQMLSTSTGIAFVCDTCSSFSSSNNKTRAAACTCAYLLHHPLTSFEIKECLKDLKVLNRSDFKNILNWRLKMQQALVVQKEAAAEGNDDDDGDKALEKEVDDDMDSDQEEEAIQNEIQDMKLRKQRERKRKKKKEKAVLMKRRKQATTGMEIDVDDNDQIFSLASIPTGKDLNQLSEVNLDETTDEQIFGTDDGDVVVGHDSDIDSDNDAERRRRRELDLDNAYEMYLQSTKDGAAKADTKMAKRSKKKQRVQEEAVEDEAMVDVNVNDSLKTYAKLLQGNVDPEDESSDSDEDDDDGFYEAPMTPSEHAQKDANPLMYKLPDEPNSAKTARWFSNPLFESIGQAVSQKKEEQSEDESGSDSSDNDYESETSLPDRKRAQKDKKASKKSGLNADEILASMPKTDKQIRHERRLKRIERDERKKARRAKKLGETDGDFQLVAASDESDDEPVDEKMKNLTEPQKQKLTKARELIKAGLGNVVDDEKDGFEVVKADAPLPRMDDRLYDSDHEDYDSDDYARTLALGTMILRRSKEKAFVDASYNRYAWNDPSDLPEWFVDDEAKHYRPQLPIPPALVAKMKAKMLALSTKPIAKVAEARARKNKRAKDKLAAAKKKAEAVANSADMTESMKLKAISKALRGHDAKKPGRTYVVAKKGRNNKTVKGAKLVDKRMKSDKRGMDRAEKRKGKKRRR